MTYHLGIDAGSSYLKLALIDESGALTARHILPRGSDIDAACRQGYDDILNQCGIEAESVEGIIATGYGRKQVSFCEMAITEITALAAGGFHADPDVRAIIDIGGQDSKVIALDAAGNVVDFVMNQKCSAGTGKFLEVTSASLGVSVEQLGPLSLKADKTLRLSSTCTVFAESEIISCVASGQTKENIIKALHNTIAAQTLGLFFQTSADPQGKILFAGGVALNKGMVAEISAKLGRTIIVPPHPQYLSAWGAALFLKAKQHNSRSDSHRKDY